jgi:hypothetical protein
LWWTGDAYGNVDLEDLPLTTETKARLATWADKYDTTLNRSDPASSGFPSADEKRAFIEEGHDLLRSLKRELGADYIVTYRPDAFDAGAPPMSRK